MGRPRKNDTEKRSTQINLHLTVDEKSKILSYAAASGCFPPEWIHKKIFEGKFPPLKLSPLNAATYQELRKIGVNLNQATHKLNQGEFPKELGHIQLELLSKLNEILKLLVDDRQSN